MKPAGAGTVFSSLRQGPRLPEQTATTSQRNGGYAVSGTRSPAQRPPDGQGEPASIRAAYGQPRRCVTSIKAHNQIFCEIGGR